MAKLTYTSESKAFMYEDGSYILTGNKVSIDGNISSVDGGNISKDGAYLGNFYARYENGNPLISINNVPMTEITAAYGFISDLLAALNTENE